MKQGSDLLIDGKVLVIQVDLVETVGLKESVFLQQLHYWLKRSENVRDGRTWVYKSVKEWQEENFPFWSESTIKRLIKSLKDKGLLLTGNYNKICATTVWYTIDYDLLEEMKQLVGSKCTNRLGQNEPTSRVKLNQHHRLHHENTPENTPEEKTETEKKNEKDPLYSFLEKKATLPTASMVKQSLLYYRSTYPDKFPPMENVDIITATLVNEQVHLHSTRYADGGDPEVLLTQVKEWFAKRYRDGKNPSYALADVQYVELCRGLNIEPRRSSDQLAGRKSFNSNLRQLFFDLDAAGATVRDYRDWLKKRRRLSIQDAVSTNMRQSFCSEFGEELV